MSTSNPLENLGAHGENGELGEGGDPEVIVELLDDDDAVEMFRSATTPKTVSELAEECDLPLSTAYRKVEKLEDAGLFRQVTPQSLNGSPPAQYRRAVDGVTVTLKDDITVQGVSADDA